MVDIIVILAWYHVFDGLIILYFLLFLQFLVHLFQLLVSLEDHLLVDSYLLVELLISHTVHSQGRLGYTANVTTFFGLLELFHHLNQFFLEAVVCLHQHLDLNSVAHGTCHTRCFRVLSIKLAQHSSSFILQIGLCSHVKVCELLRKLLVLQDLEVFLGEGLICVCK